MRPETLLAEWGWIEERLGSAAGLDASARESGALVRRRHIRDGSALLRLCLGYGCGLSLREAAAWAGLSGIGSLSDVAVLKRLRGSADWLAALAGRLMAARLPQASGTIRIIDGSMVRAPGGGLWRLHAVYDLAGKRFSHIEVTDRSGAERHSATRRVVASPRRSLNPAATNPPARHLGRARNPKVTLPEVDSWT